jgi:anti-anti-sigma factor
VDIRVEQSGEVAVVSIAGDIDALTADEASAFLNAQLDGGREQLVLDLGQVKFMSSSGIRLLLEILKKSREQGGDLRLAQAPAGVARTLEITGLARILKAYPSVDEAVGSFDS